MNAKLSRIIGLTKAEFDDFVKAGDISLSEARLLPISKPGDEVALTSVILSSIRLVAEFRKIVFSNIGTISSGQLYVFTEVSFKKHHDRRVDGMILVVKGGTIRDAALFEMKNGNSELEVGQIERYLQLAKEYSIPKLVTISNQFVTESSQCPINIKPVKDVSLYHLSWSYLLTAAHILLFKKELNIEDEDQVEIMREVVAYLEDKRSGIVGFNQMKPGWGSVIEKINTGASIKIEDKDVCDAVISWQQEESDMALILSRHLGVFVESGNKKFKGDLAARWTHDKTMLVNEKRLGSTLRVRDAVSDINIDGLLEKRTVEMQVSLVAPHGKTIKGQVGWLARQLDYCKRKSEQHYNKLHSNLHVGIRVKGKSVPIRVSLAKLEDSMSSFADKEIIEFQVIYINDFGKLFNAPKKFVEMIETMLIDFYSCIIQHLKNWEPSAPKMPQNKESESQSQAGGAGEQTSDVSSEHQTEAPNAEMDAESQETEPDKETR